MIEKAYKAMGVAGVVGLVSGIILIVTGVTTGIVLIISSAKLYKTKNGLTF